MLCLPKLLSNVMLPKIVSSLIVTDINFLAGLREVRKAEQLSLTSTAACNSLWLFRPWKQIIFRTKELFTVLLLEA